MKLIVISIWLLKTRNVSVKRQFLGLIGEENSKTVTNATLYLFKVHIVCTYFVFGLFRIIAGPIKLVIHCAM